MFRANRSFRVVSGRAREGSGAICESRGSLRIGGKGGA